MAAYNLPYSGVNYKLIGSVVLFLSHFFSTYLNLRQYFKQSDKRMPKKLRDLKGYELSTEEFLKTKQYNAEKMAFTIIKSTIDLIITVILIYTNYFPMIWETLYQSVGNLYIAVVLFTVIETIRSIIFDAPFNYYHTFHLENKYEFNKTTYRTFVTDKIKGLIISVIIGNVFYCLITFIMEYFQERFLMLAWAATTVLTLFMT